MAVPITAPAWAETQEALRDMVDRLTTMLRTVTATDALVLGEWTAGDVAMHLSQAWLAVPGLARGDLSSVYAVLPDRAATAGDAMIRDIWELGQVTTLGVATDPERNLRVLADRIDERAAAFFAYSADKSGDEPLGWMVQRTTVPRATMTCHLLNETIVHGYDIARATGMPWPIDGAYAAAVLRGFVVPIINALDPRAMVDQHRAAGLRARYDLRLRGDGRVTFVFHDGAVHVEGESSGPVDCHISADPAEFLLISWGRKSQWPAIAKGQITAWGRKPWLGPRFRSLLRNP